MTNEEKINLIGQKILLLSNNLDKYKVELDTLKKQLEFLQATQNTTISKKENSIITPPVEEKSKVITESPVTKIEESKKGTQAKITYNIPTPKIKQQQANVNIEEYIGGNLISKIGIAILVIGIAIGVKYAIDEGLISPLTRIVLGYLAGTIILLVALKLKVKHNGFSAILLSGAMASIYFTTFAAYSFYNLFPQAAAFFIMTVFTAFTVFAATIYDRQEIGIFGLVGAYAVPFMLSDGSGRVEIMFSYMTIINIGILILSFKKNWNILNHISYVLSWLIFGLWFINKYDWKTHQTIAIVFSFLFFIIFYINLMAYKTIKKEPFSLMDVIRILLNSFIYFGIGYTIFNKINYGNFLGLFTLGNALVHLVFSYSVFKNKQIDRKLFYLLIAMVLCFVTIAIPVQLDGNWVTLFWASEIFLLFSIGRTKNIQFYEWLAYAMIVPAGISLIDDWGHVYSTFNQEIIKHWKIFFNITFLTSLIVIASLSGLIFLHNKKPLPLEKEKKSDIYKVTGILIPVVLFFIVFFSINNEISNFWYSKYYLSEVQSKSSSYAPSDNYTYPIYDASMLILKNIWQINYTLIFFSIYCLLAIKKWKSEVIGWSALGAGIFATLFFTTLGLSQLSDLRDNYLSSYNSEYYMHSSFYIYIRYICLILVGILLYLTYKLCKTEKLGLYGFPKIYSSAIIHFFIIIILSSELTHIVRMDSYGSSNYLFSLTNTYKIGFTVLWSIYSFALVIYGMIKKQKMKRISGIILFGLTLIKLFIYDISNLSTGYKVIAFVVLGVLLLVVSFLYQEFKFLLFGDENESKNAKK